MDITQFVEALRRDLTQAAEVGGEEIRAAADRLTLALDPAVRLTLMDALSEAASEITNELQGTSVEVRLKGREPVFVVHGEAAGAGMPQPPAPPAPSTPADPDDDEADETVARITLRLPESLKAKAEELAAQRGQSLNTWLVNAARAAASGSTVNININTPFGPGAPGRNRSSNKRIQGWVR
ncbi:MAG: toxin-antitoxin system HicB family antitoxin [Propionibacteriales bacterium]|nr:toxin-antitoxin system HicB family antitoxin [Propionibacteriales bacterium]